jgi:hypothetical protein
MEGEISNIEGDSDRIRESSTSDIHDLYPKNESNERAYNRYQKF